MTTFSAFNFGQLRRARRTLPLSVNAVVDAVAVFYLLAISLTGWAALGDGSGARCGRYGSADPVGCYTFAIVFTVGLWLYFGLGALLG